MIPLYIEETQTHERNRSAPLRAALVAMTVLVPLRRFSALMPLAIVLVLLLAFGSRTQGRVLKLVNATYSIAQSNATELINATQGINATTQQQVPKRGELCLSDGSFKSDAAMVYIRLHACRSP